MASILKHGNRKKEKGLTLVEVVISLAIITIVSAAVVSISIYSTTALSNSNIKNYFVHETNSIAKLYLSYDETDYKTAFYDLTGTAVSDGDTTTLYYASDYHYVDSSNPAYYLTATYSNAKATLTIASFHSNGTEIYSMEYNK